MSTTLAGQPLRWGFVGASGIAASALAPAVLGEAGHELVAVAARDEARAKAFAQRFGVPHAHGGYAGLLARDDIDAVYVSLRNHDHAEWTIAALSAGKHVLCEKPLALNAGEVARMAEAAQTGGRRLMEAICSGFHPQYGTLDALLASGQLGELVSIEARFANNLPGPHGYHWRAEQGGGALYDIGCYCVAMIRRLVGRLPYRVSGFARQRRGVDAAFQGLLDFGGFSAGFTCSFDGGLDQQMTIAGTGGRITVLRPYSAIGQLTAILLDGRRIEFEPMNPYAAMIAHFREAILSGGPLRHDPQEALGQAMTLDALRRAAGSGVVVPVGAQAGLA